VCILLVMLTYITPTLYTQPDPIYTVQIQVGQNLCLLGKTLLLITPLKLCAFASAVIKASDVRIYGTGCLKESRSQMDDKQQPYIASLCT